MLEEGDRVRVVPGELPMAGQTGVLVRRHEEPYGCLVWFGPAYKTVAYHADELERVDWKGE